MGYFGFSVHSLLLFLGLESEGSGSDLIHLLGIDTGSKRLVSRTKEVYAELRYGK
jgi:hypothetical protein